MLFTADFAYIEDCSCYRGQEIAQDRKAILDCCLSKVCRYQALDVEMEK